MKVIGGRVRASQARRVWAPDEMVKDLEAIGNVLELCLFFFSFEDV